MPLALRKVNQRNAVSGTGTGCAMRRQPSNLEWHATCQWPASSPPPPRGSLAGAVMTPRAQQNAPSPIESDRHPTFASGLPRPHDREFPAVGWLGSGRDRGPGVAGLGPGGTCPLSGPGPGPGPASRESESDAQAALQVGRRGGGGGPPGGDRRRGPEACHRAGCQHGDAATAGLVAPASSTAGRRTAESIALDVLTGNLKFRPKLLVSPL